jgi:hypothetical protein
MSIIGSLLPWIDRGFRIPDTDEPNAGGFVHFYEAGLNTDKDTFAQADLDPGSVNSNPVELDSTGRATIFLEAGGYDVEVYDANMVLLYTVEGVEDIGKTILATIGQLNLSGARNVTDGYTVLATDYFITVDGSGGPDPTTINLQAVADRTQALTVKNVGSTGVKMVPNGSDTIELTLTDYTINAVTTPTILPTVTFGPSVDDDSYLIVSSHAQ